MKCKNCGFENKSTAKFCTKCGAPINEVKTPVSSGSSNNTKYVIIALVVVILVLVGTLSYVTLALNHDDTSGSSQNNASVSSSQSSEDNPQTEPVSSSQSPSSSESKSWELIGSYSGSGSGSQTISVPAGQIMIKLSAYPIKNYATNHLYVRGSNGESGGVDWGSHSDVETRSDSFSYTSSSPQTFTIDYYETVSWQVEFYRYQ